MAITFLQTQKRQRYLILILALAIFIILFVVWRGFSKEEANSVLPAFVPRQLEINWQTLQDQKLLELQALATTTPFEGKIGRTNPFLPY